MNNLALSVALATAPSSAFAELRERPRFWFPLLLVVFATVGLTYWYYSVVDIEWFKDLMFGNEPVFQKMDEDKRAVAMAMYTRDTLLWGSMVWAIVAIPVIFLLEALYLLLAAKVTKLSLGLKHWFALVCWSSLPLLLASVVSAILLFLADSAQVSPSVLAPLSINELLFHVPPGGPGHTLLTSLGVTAILSWALMIIGIRVWSQRSWVFSASVALLPWIVIYGCWAFLAFR